MNERGVHILLLSQFAGIIFGNTLQHNIISVQNEIKWLIKTYLQRVTVVVFKSDGITGLFFKLC